jgi:hypothetical protein
MFVRQGLLLTAIGVAWGVTAAADLTCLMTALLFLVSPLDPVTYLAVSLVLATAAGLASYIPTRRATSIQVGMHFRVTISTARIKQPAATIPTEKFSPS